MARKQQTERARPPSEVLPEEVWRLRRARGWSQAKLAEELTAQGWAVGQTTVAKIEATGAGRRQVTVDELFRLAFALGVTPIALLVPPEPEAFSEVAPAVEVEAADVRAWVQGRQRLVVGEERAERAVQLAAGHRPAETEADRFYLAHGGAEEGDLLPIEAVERHEEALAPVASAVWDALEAGVPRAVVTAYAEVACAMGPLAARARQVSKTRRR
ncbi:MAG: helix-turn-helix domain-containing protein [Acidimicrobiales bacterium]|nr:helix-turn-helix domain-containing protein [Acidimicrobiales bacterium]